MSNKATTLRERVFSNLASIRKRDSEKQNTREHIKRVMKRVVSTRAA